MKNSRILLMMFATIISFDLSAQEVTYVHDASKRGQFMVQEIGDGRLTPELYYLVVHNKYRNEAAITNKNGYRFQANGSSLLQVAMADSIKSNLEDRAKVEAKNMADRKIDLAWLTEGNKIENRLLVFKNNINGLVGRTNAEEIEEWQELGEQFDFAIKTIKSAYLPNSERQRQYLAIYEELTNNNDRLLTRIRFLATKNMADGIIKNFSKTNHRISENATAGYNRWRDAANHVNIKKSKQ